MRDFFTSRHVRWLENEVADLKKRHDAQILDLKLSHQAEMDRLLAENKRLQEENDRIRISLGQPSSITPVEEPSKPIDQDAMPIFTGTPWEKVIQRERWLESPAGKRWMKKNWDATPLPETKEIASADSK